MQPKGSIVIDELIIPIVDIYLDGGGFQLLAEITGPCRAVDRCTDYVVCDRSGSVVYRSTGRNMVGWSRLEPLDTLTITVSIDAIGKLAV